MGFCANLGPHPGQIIRVTWGHAPSLRTNHEMGATHLGKVLGADHAPDVANGIEKVGALEKPRPVHNEVRLYPCPVVLRILVGLEHVTATAQEVSSIRIDADGEMFLAQARALCHVEAVPFDGMADLLKRKYGGDREIHGDNAPGANRS